MMSQNCVEISEIYFGVRYQKYWHILDISGEIIDKILRDKGSPFSANYFPILRDFPEGKELLNDKLGYSLIITNDNLIFKHVIGKTEGTDLEWFLNSVKSFIIPDILVSFKIKQIMRLGLLSFHDIEAKDIADKFIETAFEKSNAKVTKFNFSFSEKIPIDISEAKKNINDYINVIYSGNFIVEKTCRVGLDYQYYFDPYIDHLDEWGWDIKKYFDKCKTYLEDVYYPWLRRHLIK